MALPTETDPSDLVEDAIQAYDEELFQVAALGLGFGAGIFVIRRGWRLVKSLIN